MKINIVEYLKSLPADEIVCYIPNPGNAGDALISCATFRLFRKMGIKYRIADVKKECFRSKIVFYPGGGNLVSYYCSARNSLRKIVEDSPKRIIILPHTINDHGELLKSFRSNVDIIARELISYQFVKDAAPQANVLLADDMAFCLDVEGVLGKNFLSLMASFVFRCRLGGRVLQNLRTKAGFLRRICKMFFLLRRIKGDVLNAFRTDSEATSISVPDNNIDLSETLRIGGVYLSEVPYCICSYLMLKTVSRFKVIRTNRLHVAITGALLGKEVFLYSNAYYKNEAVFNNSIRDRFPNVHWMGSADSCA